MSSAATKEANDRTVDAAGTGYDGKLEGCSLPPTLSITMNATTFGIHAKLSNLYRDGDQ